MAYSIKKTFSIKTFKDLEQILETSQEELHELASSMHENVNVFYKTKSNGGKRPINNPCDRLKNIQRKINWNILQRVPLPYFFHGSVVGKSPKTNASNHVGKPFLLTLDIKNFYPNIHYSKVYKVFLEIGCSHSVAKTLTKLTTFNGTLAQGFPTSSSLANLALLNVASRLEGIKKQHQIEISVYQDDLAISGGFRIPQLQNLLRKIFEQEGFELHIGDKQKQMPFNSQQKVTGYTVNRKVNVSKAYYRDLRKTIYLCKVLGVQPVAKDIPAEKFLRKVRGKIQFVTEVNPQRGEKLMKDFETISDTLK